MPALSLVALIALGGSAAYRLRMFARPMPQFASAAAQKPQHGEPAEAAAARLFGGAAFDVLSLIKLTGVLAPASAEAGNWQAQAVVQVADAAPVVVAPGAVIAPGVTLEQIRTDAILVRSAGRTREIPLSIAEPSAQGWLR